MADRQTLERLDSGSEVERPGGSEPEQAQDVPVDEPPKPSPEEAFAPEPERRPLLIKAVCAWVFIMVVLMILGLLIPTARENVVRAYGKTAIPIAALTVLFNIAGMVEYWRMRRSGIYAFAAMTALNAGWLTALGKGVWIDLIGPLAYTFIGFMYWKRMK